MKSASIKASVKKIALFFGVFVLLGAIAVLGIDIGNLHADAAEKTPTTDTIVYTYEYLNSTDFSFEYRLYDETSIDRDDLFTGLGSDSKGNLHAAITVNGDGENFVNDLLYNGDANKTLFVFNVTMNFNETKEETYVDPNDTKNNFHDVTGPYPASYPTVIPVFGKDDPKASSYATSKQASYVTLEAMEVEGYNYRGEFYEGDIYGLQMAGVYKVKPGTVSYTWHQGGMYAPGTRRNSRNEEEDGTKITIEEHRITNVVSIPAGSRLSPTTRDRAGNVNEMDMLFVPRTTVKLNTTNDGGIGSGAINNNFNLSSSLLTYGGLEKSGYNDFNEIVKVYSETEDSGSGTNFAFSTRSRKTFTFARGIGSGVTVGSATDASAVQDYLSVCWDLRDPYDPESMAYSAVRGKIRNAGNYRVTIGANAETIAKIREKFLNYPEADGYSDSVFNPIYVEDSSGAQYFQSFHVNTRELNFKFNLNPVMLNPEAEIPATGIVVSKSKNYDNTTNAAGLFSAVVPTGSLTDSDAALKKTFTTEMNVLESDFDMLIRYADALDATGANRYAWFDFTGSAFDDKNIGAGKNVTFQAAIAQLFTTGVDEIDDYLFYLPANYTVYVRDWTASANLLDRNRLGNYFTILPPVANFSLSGNSGWNNITYGDVEKTAELNLQQYLQALSGVVTNTSGSPVVSDGGWTPNFFESWRIIVQHSQDGKPSIVSSAFNRIYIVLSLAVRVDDSVSDADVAYIDAENNKYSYYSYNIERLYAGSYYIIPTVHVVTSGSPEQVTAENGGFSIVSGSQEIMRMTYEVSGFTVNKKDLQIKFTSFSADKEYDGTDRLSEFSATQDGLTTHDSGLVEFFASAAYNNGVNVGSHSIDYRFELRAKPGAYPDEVSRIVSSYDMDPQKADLSMLPPGTQISSGIISPKPLTVTFLDDLYERNVGEYSWVAVRVALEGDSNPNGGKFTEDYYYYYAYNETGVVRSIDPLKGYCYESELPARLNAKPGAIVKIALSAMVPGEGFDFDPTVKNFVGDSIDEFNPYLILSWIDPVTTKPLTSSTNSTPLDGGGNPIYYILNIRSSEEYTISNYIFRGDDTAYLDIGKREVADGTIKNIEETPDNRLVYDGNSRIDDLFEGSTIRIDFTAHVEYAARADLEGHSLSEIIRASGGYSSIIEIVGYVNQYGAGDTKYSISLDDENVQMMRYAGTYTLRLHLPETRNYKAYDFPNAEEPGIEIEIHPKEVMVYLSYARRTYGDPEITYAAYNDEVTDINYYVAYVTNSGLFVDAGALGANEVYVSNPADKEHSVNTVFYEGLIPGERMSQLDRLATVTINLAEDRAGTHPGAVRADGAYKLNYEFNYQHTATLFVFPKPLTLVIDDNQEKYYTGNTVVPSYHPVEGEPGALEYYIRAFKGPEDDDFVPDEDFTAGGDRTEKNKNVMAVGEYELGVYVKVSSSAAQSGIDPSNYTSSETQVINLTVKKTGLKTIEDALSVTKGYNGKNYELSAFSVFFVGSYIDGTGAEQLVIALVDWGDLAVQEIKKSDTSVLPSSPSTDDMVDMDTYTLTILATIRDSEKNNLYFHNDSVPEDETLTEITFYVKVTISAYEFQESDLSVTGRGYTNPSNPTELRSLPTRADDPKAFYMTYNAYDASFTHTLTPSGLTVGEMSSKVPIVVSISPYSGGSEYLYSYNGRILDPKVSDDVSYALTVKLPSGVEGSIESRSSLRNVGSVKIRYYINNSACDEYNKNYSSSTFEYSFEIEPASLRVYLNIEGVGESISRYYHTNNSAVEARAYYTYSALTGAIPGRGDYAAEEKILLGSDATDEDLKNQLVRSGTGAPRINWGFDSEVLAQNDGYYAPVSRYHITTMGDSPLSNYVFEHQQYNFDVEPAILQIEIYGTEIAGEYYDYIVYTGDGANHTPSIAFYVPAEDGGWRPMTEDEMLAEHVYDEGKKLIDIEGSFIGADRENITLEDIGDYAEVNAMNAQGKIDYRLHTGSYVFSVGVAALVNYRALEPVYYCLDVTPAPLTLQILEPHSGMFEHGQGSASKIYDGTSNFPTYYAQYVGFVGNDRLSETERIIRHIGAYTEHDPNATDGWITDPYYQIVDYNTEAPIDDPMNVGEYKIKIIEEGHGAFESRDYSLTVDYFHDSLPLLNIDPREILVERGSRPVQKTYDSTTSVPRNAVTSDTYVLSPVEGIEESGVVGDDEVNISFDFSSSFFARKTVYDENGVMSVIDVTMKINGVQNNNNYVVHNADMTVILSGVINQADADISFYSDDGNLVSGTWETVYNGLRRAVNPMVRGVRTVEGNYEMLTKESHQFTENYACAAINYNSAEAPRHAQDYTYTLTIIDDSSVPFAERNYRPTTRTLRLRITRADVEIFFGGDIFQTYSAVTGLTARAFWRGDKPYPEGDDLGTPGEYPTLTDRNNGGNDILPVNYYLNDVIIISIVEANAGVYIAKAVFNETQDFNYKEATQEFTIKRCAVNIVASVASVYSYTGLPVEAYLYFDFRNRTEYPDMLFDYVDENGNAVPFNYGENPLSSGTPFEAGKYLVRPANTMQNFEITGNYVWEFTILPVNLSVKVNDLTITEGEAPNFGFTLVGAMNNESISVALTALPNLKYFDSSTGNEIPLPDKAGVYRVEAYGGASRNYIIRYDYGILVINKKALAQQTPDNMSETGDVVVEGSFRSDASLVVRTADTTEFNRFNTMFEMFKATNADYESFSITGIITLNLSDGSITSEDGQNMTIRVYSKSYFDALMPAASADDGTEISYSYYVARIDEEGNIEILNAERDGDYLVFDTDKLATFAILAESNLVKRQQNLDWLLYLGIGVGVLAIGIALLIVKLKA